MSKVTIKMWSKFERNNKILQNKKKEIKPEKN